MRSIIIITIAAVIMFGMAACDGGSGGGGGGGGSGGSGNYKLTWGIYDQTFSLSVAEFAYYGFPLTLAGSNAGYITGNTASQAFSQVNPAVEYGISYGTFEILVEFKRDGIGAPQELKSAMLAKKANVPVGGVFGYSDFSVAFYIERL